MRSHQKFEVDGYVTPYGDSPLDDENVGENVYLNMINQAYDYLYITTPTKLEFIRLIGLFEDPIIAKQFETYCEEQCTDCGDCIDYQQEEFPIDNDMIDALIELTIQELVILFSQAKQDINNNSAENTSNG